MNDVLIKVDGLSKSFGDIQALKNVSMNFATGKLYGIIGPAGAGKTTLFRIMLGLMHADSGKIMYVNNGNSLTVEKFREQTAYMPQTQSLYADL